nr:retrovirus-related Pol polyprotein from transposon TNT 1-94 [Tanacetum cinerariifolium]
MDQPNPTFAKILIIDTEKFKQWKFRIPQYLQNEHYAIREVIEFGDSYKAPPEETGKGLASESSAKKKGRTVVITTKDMQKRRNGVKARTTLLLALPDEHHGKGEVLTTSVLTDSIKVSAASTDVAAASLSHDTIDEDDIEEIDIKYNMALLSMRADRFWKKTSNKITIQGSDVAADEEENHALVADDEVPTEFALMAKLSSSLENKVYDDSYCSKSCRKNTENLNTKISKLNEELSNCETDLYNYKRGLERDVEIRNNKIEYLMNELEQVKKEKESLDNKLTGFESASKDLDNVLGSQRSDKNREGLGYNAVPPFLYKSIYLIRKICFGQETWPKNNYTHKSMTPRAVLHKPGTTPRVVSRSNMNVSQPKMISFAKTSHSKVKRYFQRKSVDKDEPRVPRVPTVDSNFPTAKSTFTADLGKKGKAVKALACWIWRTKQNTTKKCLNCKGVFVTFKKYQYIDTQSRLKSDSGCSRYMTGNLSYLSKYEHYDGGYVSFGHRGGNITGKQHKASYKSKLVNFVSKPLHTLHMYLFRPTSISSLNHKWYCLVVIDDFSRFTWTFFLRTKDETSSIFKNFITKIENLKDLKVKIIWCDNGGDFKNKEINDFCTKKGIRKEFSNARTPRQNRVAERRNRTLIEATRTMLDDAKLPVTFCAEAVNTACYIQNMVLVNKSQNKTPYELFNSRTPALGFLRPFGCHVMTLNTLDHLGKFDAKGVEGYFVGYSLSSKAFRVFNKRTKKVEENLHVDFLENKHIGKGAGPNWLFDIDTLTNSMNYVPVAVTGKSFTNTSGIKDVASQYVKKDVSSLRYFALPNWFHEAHMEIRNSDAPDGCNADDPKSSGISNPTATSKVPQLIKWNLPYH